MKSPKKEDVQNVQFDLRVQRAKSCCSLVQGVTSIRKSNPNTAIYNSPAISSRTDKVEIYMFERQQQTIYKSASDKHTGRPPIMCSLCPANGRRPPRTTSPRSVRDPNTGVCLPPASNMSKRIGKLGRRTSGCEGDIARVRVEVELQSGSEFASNPRPPAPIGLRLCTMMSASLRDGAHVGGVVQGM